MSVIRSAVTGVGAYLPERIVTNEELSHVVDTSDEWIRERSGIARAKSLEEFGVDGRVDGDRLDPLILQELGLDASRQRRRG